MGVGAVLVLPFLLVTTGLAWLVGALAALTGAVLRAVLAVAGLPLRLAGLRRRPTPAG